MSLRDKNWMGAWWVTHSGWYMFYSGGWVLGHLGSGLFIMGLGGRVVSPVSDPCSAPLGQIHYVRTCYNLTSPFSFFVPCKWKQFAHLHSFFSIKQKIGNQNPEQIFTAGTIKFLTLSCNVSLVAILMCWLHCFPDPWILLLSHPTRRASLSANIILSFGSFWASVNIREYLLVCRMF